MVCMFYPGPVLALECSCLHLSVWVSVHQPQACPHDNLPPVQVQVQVQVQVVYSRKQQQWGYKQCTRHTKDTLREYLNNIQNHNKILSNTVVHKYHVYLIAWWADCEHDRHHSIFINPHDIFIINIFILSLHIQWDNHWCQSPAIQIKGLKPQRVYISL